MKLLTAYGKYYNHFYLVEDGDEDILCLELLKWRLKSRNYYFDEDEKEARRIIRSRRPCVRARKFLEKRSRDGFEYERIQITDIELSDPYREVLFGF